MSVVTRCLASLWRKPHLTTGDDGTISTHSPIWSMIKTNGWVISAYWIGAKMEGRGGHSLHLLLFNCIISVGKRCLMLFLVNAHTLSHTHIRPNVSVMIWDDVIFFKHFQECLECSVRPFVGCFCLGRSASEEFLFLNCLNETNAICLLVFFCDYI